MSHAVRTVVTRFLFPMAVAGLAVMALSQGSHPVGAAALDGVTASGAARSGSAVTGMAASVVAATGTTGTTGSAASALVLASSQMVAPVPGIAPHGPQAAALAGRAAQTCAAYAARAGFADNGYYSGDLVTATAICVAESTGDPKLYVCDDNGAVVGHGDYNGTKPACPARTTSYDRGLWQLNSKHMANVSDQCAFNPVCNAMRAYRNASVFGETFARWSSYDQDSYAGFIDPAQKAATALGTGTVTSAELSECLAWTRHAAGGKVVVANCGGGAASEQWSVTGGKLRAGKLCAAIASATARNPGIVLYPCAARKTQRWVTFGRDELRNAADGRCLTDPNGSGVAGTQVDVTFCANAKQQTWWLP